MDLNTKVEDAGRSYKLFARRLKNLGIETLQDFIFHFPFRYDDFSLVSKIGQVDPGETGTIRGTVEKIENNYTRKWKSLQKTKIQDSTGSIDVIWFNQPYITKGLKEGDEISLSGKVSLDKNKLIMKSPSYEIASDDEYLHTGRLVPIYPETRGISSKWIRRQIYKILKDSNLKDYMPEEILREYNLENLSKAIQEIHFPHNIELAQKAKERLSFDEMFNLHLESINRKATWKKNKINPWTIDDKKIEEFIHRIPFELTNAQKQAIEEILKDLKNDKPMNRLLEGDVGSGKTIVAAIATYAAFLNKKQSAFMAPTEILANQHYKTLSQLLSPFNIKVQLFTSSQKGTKDFDIAVGTHALVYKKVEFKDLGMVVIDEQQRFGVEQRATLKSKGDSPHLLTMTATPIPRTVALTMYGDLDLSVLDEMPKGRMNIKTWLVPPSKRNGAYKWIEEKIKKDKAQVFIVCPLIEESESLVTVKAAKKEFETLSRDIFPKLKLGLLHGKLTAREKGEVLNKFKQRKFDILVSTPVVEVGIDIPTATIMMIEEADRFGLAQLHQLRGRVGRNDIQSFCLLFTATSSLPSLQRLKAMETIYSGPQLAELDLKLRGPGQIHGTMQHGVPKLKIASFSDFQLIEKTKIAAEKVFSKIDNYPEIEEKIRNINSKKISPD